ncbi:MAG: hypothetical protein IKI03_09375 [Clostridia bacterium]|nr:hypothetical protein [Clostridia bacterium]
MAAEEKLTRSYEGNGYFAIIKENGISTGMAGEEIFRLSAVSAVDRDGREDEEISLGTPEIEEDSDGMTVVWTAKSSLWDKKEYVFRFTPDHAAYCVRVYGRGAVDGIDYFIGNRKDRFYGSGYEAADYTAPLGLANSELPGRIFTTAEDTYLGFSLTGGFSPVPLAFSFRTAGIDGRFLLGIAALRDNCSFDGLTYKSLQFGLDIARFCLHSGFGGYQEVDGFWESPPILILTADTDLDCMRRYAQWHYDRGVPRAVTGDIPAWWRGPFFCGWKEQAVAPGYASIFDAASQDCYQRMSDTLDERGLRPSVIIIDDKWQKEYGTALPDGDKWPDMRGFIEEQHAKGRRVVLWFKSWNPEGLPEEECILSESGKKLSLDPTSPAYRARIKDVMHTLLSADEGCMNADGFKIDSIIRIPLEKNMRIHEKGYYGVSLLYRFIELIFTEAKRVKPDALMNNSCCHPLLAAFTDQARLHDTHFALRDSVRFMRERAELFDAMMPGISVDTDAGSGGTRRDFMRYARECSSFGVPDLYVLNPIEDSAVTEEDWEEIRRIWEEYRRVNGLS